MSRKPRIEIAGYYHIINRGVEQRAIFKEANDYEEFEELMCFYAKSQKGYSQHIIAKVLELNQATVQRIIKRTE